MWKYENEESRQFQGMIGWKKSDIITSEIRNYYYAYQT